MPTLTDIMTELESLGTEQNRKIYTRHGITPPMFGVSFAHLDALKKRLKKDDALAPQLWATGNHDARILALKIADPAAVTSDLLEAWANDVTNYTLSDALSGFVAQTPHLQDKAERWSRMDDEWHGATGWNLVGSLAMQKNDLPDSYFVDYLRRIEAELASAKNRVRHSMNQALIAIGIRNDALYVEAVKVANRIGKVVVDHGETGCKTPAAIPYMDKARARSKIKNS